jgi:hypothetical protein
MPSLNDIGTIQNMMVPKHSTFSKGGGSKGKKNIDPPIPKEREVDKQASA